MRIAGRQWRLRSVTRRKLFEVVRRRVSVKRTRALDQVPPSVPFFLSSDIRYLSSELRQKSQLNQYAGTKYQKLITDRRHWFQQPT